MSIKFKIKNNELKKYIELNEKYKHFGFKPTKFCGNCERIEIVDEIVTAKEIFEYLCDNEKFSIFGDPLLLNKVFGKTFFIYNKEKNELQHILTLEK